MEPAPRADVSPVQITGLRAWSEGGSGAPLVLVAGPPVGAAIFREVQRRLAPRRSVALELLTDEPAGIEALAGRLGAAVQRLGAAAVLAHGLAVPVAMRLETEALVILSNGPVRSLDPITSALAALPERGLCALLRPGIFRRWLGSSLGLRRAVINPYVMDRDTVAMLSEAYLSSAARRRATAAWLRDLPRALDTCGPAPRHLAAIWGDADPIYPIQQMESLSGALAVGAVTGAGMLHPEERPWALADALLEVLTGVEQAPGGRV